MLGGAVDNLLELPAQRMKTDSETGLLIIAMCQYRIDLLVAQRGGCHYRFIFIEEPLCVRVFLDHAHGVAHEFVHQVLVAPAGRGSFQNRTGKINIAFMAGCAVGVKQPRRVDI